MRGMALQPIIKSTLPLYYINWMENSWSTISLLFGLISAAIGAVIR